MAFVVAWTAVCCSRPPADANEVAVDNASVAVLHSPSKFEDDLMMSENGSLFTVHEGGDNGVSVLSQPGKWIVLETRVGGKRDGPMLYLGQDGRPRHFQAYVRGQKSGEVIMWDDNGVKRVHGAYAPITAKDGVMRVGVWTYWDSSGRIVARGPFEQLSVEAAR